MALVMETCPNMWGRVWHHAACQASPAGQTCTVAGCNGQFFTIFNKNVMCHSQCVSSKPYIFTTSFCDLMMSLMTSSHTYAAGHMTFYYKRSHMLWGGGSVARDLQEVGPLGACTGSNESGASF